MKQIMTMGLVFSCVIVFGCKKALNSKKSSSSSAVQTSGMCLDTNTLNLASEASPKPNNVDTNLLVSNSFGGPDITKITSECSSVALSWSNVPTIDADYGLIRVCVDDTEDCEILRQEIRKFPDTPDGVFSGEIFFTPGKMFQKDFTNKKVKIATTSCLNEGRALAGRGACGPWAKPDSFVFVAPGCTGKITESLTTLTQESKRIFQDMLALRPTAMTCLESIQKAYGNQVSNHQLGSAYSAVYIASKFVANRPYGVASLFSSTNGMNQILGVMTDAFGAAQNLQNAQTTDNLQLTGDSCVRADQLAMTSITPTPVTPVTPASVAATPGTTSVMGTTSTETISYTRLMGAYESTFAPYNYVTTETGASGTELFKFSRCPQLAADGVLTGPLASGDSCKTSSQFPAIWMSQPRPSMSRTTSYVLVKNLIAPSTGDQCLTLESSTLKFKPCVTQLNSAANITQHQAQTFTLGRLTSAQIDWGIYGRTAPTSGLSNLFQIKVGDSSRTDQCLRINADTEEQAGSLGVGLCNQPQAVFYVGSVSNMMEVLPEPVQAQAQTSKPKFMETTKGKIAVTLLAVSLAMPMIYGGYKGGSSAMNQKSLKDSKFTYSFLVGEFNYDQLSNPGKGWEQFKRVLGLPSKVIGGAIAGAVGAPITAAVAATDLQTKIPQGNTKPGKTGAVIGGVLAWGAMLAGGVTLAIMNGQETAPPTIAGTPGFTVPGIPGSGLTDTEAIPETVIRGCEGFQEGLLSMDETIETATRKKSDAFGLRQ